MYRSCPHINNSICHKWCSRFVIGLFLSLSFFKITGLLLFFHLRFLFLFLVSNSRSPNFNYFIRQVPTPCFNMTFTRCILPLCQWGFLCIIFQLLGSLPSAHCGDSSTGRSEACNLGGATEETMGVSERSLFQRSLVITD